MSDEYLSVARQLPPGPFSTSTFAAAFAEHHAEVWARLVEKYGVGGKGAGRYYTVNRSMADALGKLARAGELECLGYYPSPEGWGSHLILFWAIPGLEGGAWAGPALIDLEYREGSLKLRSHLRRERDPTLSRKKKAAVLAVHGKLDCELCGFDPVASYGSEIGYASIEVHHATVAVADMKEGHKTRLDDLQCLCANCHRIVHAKERATAKG
jgi:hypothetical protein